MEAHMISGHDLARMLESGTARLADRYKDVDTLNVFPVPDGDTGTNMYMTMISAVREISKAADPASVGAVAEAAARGALMGARGNSGVILSQLLRGIAKGLNNMDRITGPILAQALNEGVRTAYKSVMKPVEGTILTVAREAAEEALKSAKKKSAVANVLEDACYKGEETLNRTPGMLPALREAGVVDAGGLGWLIILQGMFTGTAVERADQPAVPPMLLPAIEEKIFEAGAMLRYPYCTEVLVKGSGADGLKEALEDQGDSLLLVEDNGYIKIHLHSTHPGQVLETCLRYGPLISVKVENMTEQVSAQVAQKGNAEEKSGLGIVSVAFGDGIKRIMESLGANKVVTGGQTMNPSTGELLEAVETAGPGKVIILPNNRNIIMTANQVAGLTGKKVYVVETRSVPQGLAALMAVIPGREPEEIIQAMAKAARQVKTGEVTYAVRDTTINGREIRKNSIIGLLDDELAVSGNDAEQTVSELLDKMISEDDEVCTLYYGDMINNEKAGNLLETMKNKFPHIEFELHRGGQPLYFYLISVE